MYEGSLGKGQGYGGRADVGLQNLERGVAPRWGVAGGRVGKGWSVDVPDSSGHDEGGGGGGGERSEGGGGPEERHNRVLVYRMHIR